MTRINVTPDNRVAVMAFLVCIGAGGALTALLHHRAPLIVGAIAGVYLLFSIKVIPPWEKVALLRLGRYVGLRGPGLFLIVPVIETLSPHVDQRVRVSSVSAESTLTRDTVPEPLLDPHLNRTTLSFRVSAHHAGGPASLEEPPIPMTIEFIDADHALLVNQQDPHLTGPLMRTSR